MTKICNTNSYSYNHTISFFPFLKCTWALSSPGCIPENPPALLTSFTSDSSLRGRKTTVHLDWILKLICNRSLKNHVHWCENGPWWLAVKWVKQLQGKQLFFSSSHWLVGTSTWKTPSTCTCLPGLLVGTIDSHSVSVFFIKRHTASKEYTKRWYTCVSNIVGTQHVCLS